MELFSVQLIIIFNNYEPIYFSSDAFVIYTLGPKYYNILHPPQLPEIQDTALTSQYDLRRRFTKCIFLKDDLQRSNSTMSAYTISGMNKYYRYV
jgi:hypothetical protein